VYTFAKQGEMKDDFKYRPYYYMDFDGESFDEKMIKAKKRKQDTFQGIEDAMGYFGKPDKIIEVVSAINRGCKVYDAMTNYLAKMPEQKPGTTILYYNVLRDVLYALLLANDLIDEHDLQEEFKNEIGSELYDDRAWISQMSELFRERYEDQKNLVFDKQDKKK